MEAFYDLCWMSEYGFLSGQAVIQTLKKKKVSEYVMQLTEEIEEYLFTMIPKVKVWSYSIWALLIENPNYYTAQISSAKNKLFLKHRYCPLCSRVFMANAVSPAPTSVCSWKLWSPHTEKKARTLGFLHLNSEVAVGERSSRSLHANLHRRGPWALRY